MNVLVTCFTQFICSSIINEKIDMLLFQFIAFPLVIVLLNVVLAFKFKLQFHRYLVAAYLGFFCSVVVFAFSTLILERPQELPPGEIVLGADLVLVIFVSSIQFITLLFLNLIIYITFKLYFFLKNVVKRSVRNQAAK